MKDWTKNVIKDAFSIRQALFILNSNGVASGVLFVTDEQGRLLGSITDGDIRRGLLKDASVNDSVADIMNRNCRRLFKEEVNTECVRELRVKGIRYVPILDEQERIEEVMNLDEYKEIIPVHAIIMAGGKGERLLPLTREIPKPLLKVGNKPIIEHTIDRLIQYGVRDIHISINYLGHQIQDYFKDGAEKDISIRYIREEKPLGTIGSLGLLDRFEQDHLLLMNSDLLTNIDYSNFYKEFSRSGADMAVATVPHHVDLPYAIVELDEDRVISLREKPRYTYFANAGIYLIKAEIVKYISRGEFLNATDLMEKVISDGKKLISYPILEYWLDIGRMNDYQKAQEDIRHLGF